MRLVSPALYYIKYLVCHPDSYTTADIQERLENERIDYLSDVYIDKVRATTKPPSPFYPTDKRHRKSFNFINDERINRLFQPDDDMRIAKHILEVPRAKEFVEVMLLVHVPQPAIAEYLVKHRNIRCTPAALQLYQHYFWNLELLDSSEMRVLLALRFNTADLRVHELKSHKKLATSAYYKDPRKVAADLPYAPTTALLAQMRLGVLPGKGNLALRMGEARDMSIMRAIESVQQDGPNDNMKFLNYVNGARILEELLQLVAKPEDHMQQFVREISLRADTKKLPSINELSGGQHTVEMAPLEDTNEGTAAGQDSPGASDLSNEGRTDG
jgi:hypothetical protein